MGSNPCRRLSLLGRRIKIVILGFININFCMYLYVFVIKNFIDYNFTFL